MARDKVNDGLETDLDALHYGKADAKSEENTAYDR